MDRLPESLRALGEQLRANGGIVPAAELYSEREVFVLELGKVFFRGWTLIDHASRFTSDGRRFLCDVATRSYIVVQEHGESVHAFRNRCLHAGYPICDEEDTQAGNLLVCKYHDWRYSLDGKLVHAPHLAPSADLSAFSLKRHMVLRRAGLLFLAPGTTPESGPGAAEPEALAIQPPWLESAQVSARRDYTLPMNWKHLHWRLPSLLPRFLAQDEQQIRHQSCGPLGLFAAAENCAVIVRLIPRSTHETRLNAVWMIPQYASDSHRISPPLDDELSAMTAGSASCATGPATAGFFDWYYSALTQPET